MLILLTKSEGFLKLSWKLGFLVVFQSFQIFLGMIIKHGSDGYIMNSYNTKYCQKDFRSVFNDLDTLKLCSMNIFLKSHNFTYEKYLTNVQNAILHKTIR